jgi:hypothetical protein
MVSARLRVLLLCSGCSPFARIRGENGTDIFRTYSRPNLFKGVQICSYPSPDIQHPILYPYSNTQIAYLWCRYPIVSYRLTLFLFESEFGQKYENKCNLSDIGPWALFACLIIRIFQLVFSARIVFFSHNKSANSSFSHSFSAKRTGSVSNPFSSLAGILLRNVAFCPGRGGVLAPDAPHASSLLNAWSLLRGFDLTKCFGMRKRLETREILQDDRRRKGGGQAKRSLANTVY